MLYTYFKIVSYQLSAMAPSPHTSIKKQHEKPYPRWYAPSCCSTLSSHYSVPLVHPFRCTSILYLYTIYHPMKDTKKDILLDVLSMTNQTYPTLALSKSGYGSKHSFTLSHEAPQSSLSVYADTAQFASTSINNFYLL